MAASHRGNDRRRTIANAQSANAHEANDNAHRMWYVAPASCGLMGPIKPRNCSLRICARSSPRLISASPRPSGRTDSTGFVALALWNTASRNAWLDGGTTQLRTTNDASDNATEVTTTARPTPRAHPAVRAAARTPNERPIGIANGIA